MRPRAILDIRRSFHMTREQFSAAIGVSLSTYANWEQGRRKPTAAAVALLTLVARNPQIIKCGTRLAS